MGSTHHTPVDFLFGRDTIAAHAVAETKIRTPKRENIEMFFYRFHTRCFPNYGIWYGFTLKKFGDKIATKILDITSQYGMVSKNI